MSKRVIVAIDLGIKKSSICYAIIQGEDQTQGISRFINSENVKVIHEWPGSEGIVNYSVPTTVAYKFDESEIICGFEYESLSEDEKVEWDEKKMFLSLLDRRVLEKYSNDMRYAKSMGILEDSAPVAPLHEEVSEWCRDFLVFVYRRIWYVLENDPQNGNRFRNLSGGKPEDIAISYVFSSLNEWDDDTIDELKGIARMAGFGQQRYENLQVRRTRAEAAAIFARESVLNSSQGLDEVNVVVCDAGKHFTTISTVKAATPENSEDYPEVRLRYTKQTSPVASTNHIDKQAEAYMRNEITSQYPDMPESSLKPGIQKAMQMFKSLRGSAGSTELSILPNLIFNVQLIGDSEGFDLFDGDSKFVRIMMKQDKLFQWFDEAVEEIKRVILEQIAGLEEESSVSAAESRVESKVILALGGELGQTEYVKKQMETAEEFSSKRVTVLQPNVWKVSVCKGLILDRIKLENHNESRGGTTIQRQISYGLVLKGSIAQRGSKGLENIRISEADDSNPRKMVDSIVWLIDSNGESPTSGVAARCTITRTFPDLKMDWEERLVQFEDGGRGHSRPNIWRPSYEGLSRVRTLRLNIQATISDLAENGAIRRRPPGMRDIMKGDQADKVELTYTVQLRYIGDNLYYELIVDGRAVYVEKILQSEDVAGATRSEEVDDDLESLFVMGADTNRSVWTVRSSFSEY